MFAAPSRKAFFSKTTGNIFAHGEIMQLMNNAAAGGNEREWRKLWLNTFFTIPPLAFFSTEAAV